MMFFLYFLHIITCIFLILVVLLQQGQGADLAVFGGGGTQTAFGARGATQVIHRLTVYSFIAFILLTLTISIVSGTGGSASVMAGVEEEAPAQSEVAGAGAILEEEAKAPEESAPVEPEAGGETPAGEPTAPGAEGGGAAAGDAGGGS